MFALLVTARLRCTVSGVLAAWVCVLLTGIAAPIARAQLSQHHLVHLCSGELAPIDAPNPMAAATHDWQPHHVLDCPLCLPLLAPPPRTVQMPLAHAGAAQQNPASFEARQVQRVALPPVRAPPAKT